MQVRETAPVKAWAVVDETGKITPTNIHASEIKAAATAKRWGKTYRVIPVFVIPIVDWSGGTDEGTPFTDCPPAKPEPEIGIGDHTQFGRRSAGEQPS